MYLSKVLLAGILSILSVFHGLTPEFNTSLMEAAGVYEDSLKSKGLNLSKTVILTAW